MYEMINNNTFEIYKCIEFIKSKSKGIQEDEVKKFVDIIPNTLYKLADTNRDLLDCKIISDNTIKNTIKNNNKIIDGIYNFINENI